MKITFNIVLNVSKLYTPEGVAEMEFHYDSIKDCLEHTLGKPMQLSWARFESEKTIVVQYDNAEAVLKKLYLLLQYAHDWNYGIYKEAYCIAYPH